MYFSEPKTLIVVYKDELMVNQLKKLVETNDDLDEGSIVGVRDGSVRIVSWTEKVWNDQKKAGNINNKVLFIGNFKDTKALIPIMEIKYDKYGIKYGWAGNQGLLVADPTVLSDSKTYNDFIECLKQYNLPDSIRPIDSSDEKQDVHSDEHNAPDNSDSGKGEEKVEANPKKKKGFTNAIGKTIGFVGKAANTISSGVSTAFSKIDSAVDDLPADRRLLAKQQYYLGIMNLYENHLEEFVQK